MGSSSDAPIMQEAATVLQSFQVPFEFTVVSAHRSPEWMYQFASTIDEAGFAVVIAGAGGAAHLPGMMAALTTVPVIGVPIKSSNSIDGWDSLLSIVQMPKDVPVATVAVNGAHNAGILAVQILSASDAALKQQLQELKERNRQKVAAQGAEIAISAVQKTSVQNQ